MAERQHPDAPKELERYLIPSERIVFQVRRNKIVLAAPFLSMIAAWVIWLRVGTWLDDRAGGLQSIFLYIALGFTLWFAYALADWWRENFLATDRRLMLVHGIVTRKVDIMPMSKVTDMRYDRTVPGYIFGYGKYVLESAGQDQALSEINYVPNPDLHYRQISDVLFGSGAARMSSERLVAAAQGDQLPVREPEYFWWKRK